MKKLLSSALLAILPFTSLSAFYPIAELNYQIGAGYRNDDFNWNISGPGGYPNVLSELKWQNLNILEVNGKVEASLGLVALKVSGDYGKIISGKNRDSDYLGNNKTKEFSRSYSKADNGAVYDVSAGAGWIVPVSILLQRIEFIPMAGYSYHQQQLTMRNGYQSIDTQYPKAIGSFPGLNSRYTARWRSPWVGMELYYDYFPGLSLFANVEYHFASYRARGHWNLRKEFAKDFKQTASEGSGVIAQLGLNYSFGCFMDASLMFEYDQWKMRNGRHTVYIKSSCYTYTDSYSDDCYSSDSSSSSSSSCDNYCTTYTSTTTSSPVSSYEKFSTNLNQVNWRTFKVIASVNYYF